MKYFNTFDEWLDSINVHELDNLIGECNTYYTEESLLNYQDMIDSIDYNYIISEISIKYKEEFIGQDREDLIEYIKDFFDYCWENDIMSFAE